MLLTEYVEVKLCPANFNYWVAKGYITNDARVGGRANVNGNKIIRVRTTDLKPNSNVRVQCKCEICGSKFENRFSRSHVLCVACHNIKKMIGNNYGTLHKGRKYPNRRGANHPRWNPNKSEFLAYSSEVRRISEETYKKYKKSINPNDYPRTLCGVDGGYQLDHVISIKKGFEQGISPKKMGAKKNLQMLTWNDNRSKHFN